MGVGVDEAGGEGAAAEVVLVRGAAWRHRAGRADERDRLAGHGKLARKGRAARPVIDDGVAEDVVEAGPARLLAHWSLLPACSPGSVTSSWRLENCPLPL
jgi:hypothetical protein